MKNKKIILLIIGILLCISALVSISYAYYIKSHNQEDSNVVKTKCLNFSITNEKNDINLDEQYPIQDTEGRKLTPYQFTITNTCEQFISYNVNLESLEATTMDSGAVKVMINNEAPVNLSTLESTSVSIDSSKDSKILATGSLGSNDSVDYTLRLWMDYGDSADTSSMNKVFESKIVVTATVGTYKPSDYVTTLHDAILVNEYGVTDVNNAINRIEAKGTPDFSQTAPIIKWVETNSQGSITKEVIKPASNAVKTDSQTEYLTENDTKLILYTVKNFNTYTGKYVLSSPVYVSGSECDFKNNHYYFINESLVYNSTSKRLSTSTTKNGKDIYEVTNVVSSNSQYKWNDTTYDSITYTLSLKQLSSIESEVENSDKGLYMAQDNYGKSYYYRGNVKNNNVYFAGYFWQIIRVNGDNSIRLLYNGNVKNTLIGSSRFNNNHNHPIYVGYMYGNINATTYEDVHNNLNSSNIKNEIDNWYKVNITDKSYESYIAKTVGFCGDRTLTSGNGIQNDQGTSFGAYGRFNAKTATLICSDSTRDFYTIMESDLGNKALTYPIGMITYDELILGGMSAGSTNSYSWVNNSSNYYSMTPVMYNSSVNSATVFGMKSTGELNAWRVGDNVGVRPVINLKADVEVSGGIGTINDPYVIKTN